jgi:hypothetical protein
VAGGRGQLPKRSDFEWIGDVRVPTSSRARVVRLRAEVAGRSRCDTATRRALLTDGDAEGLYGDVQASCPAVVEPVAPE